MRLEAVSTDYSSREQWHPNNDLETGVNAARNILLAAGPVVPMAQWNLKATILKSEQRWMGCTLCQWSERSRDAWHMMTMWGTTMREEDVRGQRERWEGEDGGRGRWERMVGEDVANRGWMTKGWRWIGGWWWRIVCSVADPGRTILWNNSQKRNLDSQ